MIALPDEFNRISLATADDELAEIVRNEYGEIPKEQQRTFQREDGTKAYLFIDLMEDDLNRLLSRYEGKFSYKLLQFELNGKEIDYASLPDLSEVVWQYFAEA